MRPALLLCLAALLIAAWYVPNRPVDPPGGRPGEKFSSLSFSAYQSWESPLTKRFPTEAEADADMALVARVAGAVRTYAAYEGDFDTAALAQKHGVKVWQGIWLSGNRADNDREIARGIALANAYPDTIIRVVVGNEVLLRRDLPVDALISDIDYVRARIKQPVAYADVTDFWKKFPQVAPHVDIVMIHFLPYWEDNPLNVDAAIANIKSTTDEFKTLFPGKTISIGETGWPSRGRWRKDAAPSRVNEAVFLRQFVTLADQEHVDYNLIEAFDQPWKYEDEGVAGANWGIWNAERIPKFPLNGGIIEHPDWPWYAVLGALFGTILLASTGFRNIRLAVPSFMLGNAFAIACAGTLPMLYDSWLILDAIINLPLQAIFAFRIINRADMIFAGTSLPPHIPAAATFAALRRGRLLLNYDSLWTIFLTSAAIFQIMLVFDPRYRDAPMPVFIIPVIAALFRFWTKDKPLPLAWEDLVAANVLAVAALASAILEGPNNLDFITWNIAALVLAGPILMIQDGKRQGVKRRRR